MIRQNFRARVLLAVLVAIYFGLAAFGTAFQYLRFISPANGAYCLLAAAGGVWIGRAIWGWGPEGKPTVAILAVLVFIYGCVEYETYFRVVVRTGMEDLSVNGIRWVQANPK